MDRRVDYLAGIKDPYWKDVEEDDKEDVLDDYLYKLFDLVKHGTIDQLKQAMMRIDFKDVWEKAGASLLETVVYSESFEKLRLLLDNCPDVAHVNALRESEDEPQLDCAAVAVQYSRIDMLLLMESKGIPIIVNDDQEEQLARFACSSGELGITSFLHLRGVYFDADLFTNYLGDDPDYIDWFVRHGLIDLKESGQMLLTCYQTPQNRYGRLSGFWRGPQPKCIEYIQRAMN